MTVKMGMVQAESEKVMATARGQHTSTSLFREAQAHLCPSLFSGIIRFLTHNYVAIKLQAPATEDAPLISSEH